MAVYEKLLLSSGGGIVSTQQQADQVKNTATVLIGLGGTGLDCLRTIKTQVFSRLKPDDPAAVVAEYSHIRFLGIDTAEQTKGDVEKEDSKNADALMALEDTEFFPIANADVKKDLKNRRALMSRTEFDWLDCDRIPAPDLTTAGAGGIRQVGRYMMMDKSEAFLSRIEQEINTAKRGLPSPTVNIHIFSGLSGGTGAGCFLDVCYMVRSIADRVGGVTIFGYFFLPDVNLSKIPFDNTKVRSFVPKNGYASMQELDYCMQLQYNGGSFVQEYQGHRKIEWKTGPVDMCHLICATNANGDVIPNAYDYAMNVTTEYVMDFLTDSNKGFDLSQQLANFAQIVRAADGEKVIGANLGYCIIGASCASIPLREINTYLASELFARFAAIKKNVPSKMDVEQFAVASLARDAQNVSGIYESIYREIREGASGDYGQYQDDWKFVRDYGNSELITHYTNQTAKQLNRAESTAKSLISSTNQKSLLGRMNNQMSSVICDLERGPIFAHRLISAAESHSLLNIIDGLIEENNSRWNQEAAQTDERFRDYETAKSDFENRRKRSFFDTDEKRFNDYEYYLMLVEQHKLAMAIYEKYGNALDEFRKQVVEVTASYYIKLARVMETLIQTFKENRDALASESVIQSATSFSVPMMTIAELKKSLDTEIEKVNIPSMLDSFMRLFVDQSDVWITEDENKISKLVTNFFVETAFNGFANRTITEFLKDKYGITNDEQLSNKIYQEWMKPLTAKASPLFYFNGSIWKESQTSKIAFVSIPTSSAPIKAAAQMMYNTNNVWNIKDSALTDRIYVMSSACALPLSAYNNCEEYETACFSAPESGRHYYEGKPVSGLMFDDWSKLPSLTPQSMLELEHAPVTMKEIIEDAQKLYEEAAVADIFDAENFICKPSEEGLNKLQGIIEECRNLITKISKAEELEEAKSIIVRLEDAMNVPMVRTKYFMQNDGYAATMETKLSVRKDHFVSAPTYHMIAREILKQMYEKKAEAEAVKEELSSKIRKIGEGGRSLVDYCEAVFTGVISVEGRVVTYHQNSFGVITDYVLSKRGAEFEYGAIPVYQGFVNYQILPEDIKEEIRKIVDERLNTDSPEITTTGKLLKDVLNDDMISAWVQLANGYSNRGDIIDFLKNLKQRFQIFCLENNIR